MHFQYKDPKYPETNYYLYFLCVLLVTSGVFIYGKIICTFIWIPDFLSYRYNESIDGWMITHLIFYTLTGIFFPNTFIMSMIIGIVWEIFEDWLARTNPKWLSGIGDCVKGSGEKMPYWYGQSNDVYTDFMGFLIGKYIFLPYL